MCGIVGYLGNREARHILVSCLARFDAGDYDSAGIGTVAAGKLKTLRSLGSNANLRAALKRTPLGGKIGVAHAYRSTRGQAYNAHSGTDNNFFAVLQDGSNDKVVNHLLERDSTGLETLLQETFPLLRGDFTLVGLCQNAPDRLLAVRKGKRPLVIGHHYDGYFIASDLSAIDHYTGEYQVLEDGEFAVISYGGVKISKFDGTPVERPLTRIPVAEETSAPVPAAALRYSGAQQWARAEASAKGLAVE